MKTKQNNSTVKYASFGRRLLASLVDGFVVSIITSPFTGHWQKQAKMLEQLSQIDNMAGLQQLQNTNMATSNAINLIATLITMLYFVIFVVNYDGATIGMRLLAIKLLPDNKSDKKISYPMAVVRSISSYLSGAVFGLGYLAMIGHPKKQTWHDRIAKTVVVQTNRKPKKIIGLIIGGLFFLFTLLMLSISIMIALDLYKNEVSNLEDKTEVNHNFEKNKNEMSEEAATKYQLSQDYFTDMKDKASDPDEIRKINNKNIDNIWETLELEPTNPIIWQQLASAYTWVNDRGNLEDGLDAAKKANEFYPNNSAMLYLLGDYYVKLGQYDQAVLELKKSLRLDPNYAYAHLVIAQAYQQLNVSESATKHYQQAIDCFENKNQDGSLDIYILTAQKGLSVVSKKN